MILVPVDPKNISIHTARHSYCKAMKIVEEFMKSEHEAAQLEFEPGEYSNAASAQSTYKRAINKLHANCFVIVRRGKVYLIKGGVFND